MRANLPLGGALALVLGLVSAMAAAQIQQVYRYVDADGKIVYTDKPPPPSAKEAQSKRIGANSIETSQLSYAVQQAQERYPVTLYTFACGVVCDSAQALLNKRGVPHSVVDVSVGEGADRLKKLAGGLDAPALQVGEQYSVGFNDTKWQAMLGDAGYPATPPPRIGPIARPVTTPPGTPTATAQTAQPTVPPKGGYPQQ